MRRVSIVFLSLLSAACELTDLSPTICQEACYTGPEGTQDIGACQRGVPVCDATGELVGCLGEVLPSSEICDGVDNDCDGLTDEYYPEAGVPCGLQAGLHVNGKSQCRSGRTVCEGGILACSGAQGPEPEICDGRDNDCDGATDEDLGFGDVCYSGDPADLLSRLTECRAGVERCVDGAWVCFGSVLPTLERCNGLDDDCDGLIDNPVTSSTSDGAIDVVLVLDRSGSMADEIERVINVLGACLAEYASTRYRFAIVDVPGSLSSSAPAVRLDLTDGISAAIELQQTRANLGGYEYSYDAFAGLANGGIPLAWTPNAGKAIIWFGDEEGQSQLGLTEQSVVNLLVQNTIKWYGFVAPRNWADYDDLATRTGGAIDFLGNLTQAACPVLTQAITNQCQ